MENNAINRTWDTGNGGNNPAPDASRPPLQPVLQQVGPMIDQARAKVMDQLAHQKESAAGSIGSAAQALRQTGQQLRDQNGGAFAPYVEGAADTMERFSRYLQERDIQEMIGEVEGFARREPAMFLGGAFALGFLAARFLKSSRPDVTLNEVNVTPDYAGARGRRESASSGPFTGPAHDLASMRADDPFRSTAGYASSSGTNAAAARPAGAGFGATTAPGAPSAAAPGSAAGMATTAPGGTPGATEIDAIDDRELASPAGVGVRSSDDE